MSNRCVFHGDYDFNTHFSLYRIVKKLKFSSWGNKNSADINAIFFFTGYIWLIRFLRSYTGWLGLGKVRF